MLLGERIRATLLLTGTATFGAWLLAIPLGIWSATRRRGWADTLSQVLFAVLLSVPDLLLAIAVLALAVETGWFPRGRDGVPRRGVDERGAAAARSAPPPCASRRGPGGWHDAALARHVRASMLEAMEAPFAFAARAHGIPSRRRLFRHLLPVAANPLVGLLGLSLGTLLSASLFIEVVMGWPGLGPLLVDSIMARDIAVVLGTILLSAVFLIGGSLLADLLLYRLDPRIRVR